MRKNWSCDLFSVLSALTKPPFEPLSGATLLHSKWPFWWRLLRLDDVVNSTPLQWRQDTSGGYPEESSLIPTAGFLAKNQSGSFEPLVIFVPDLKAFSAVAADKLWCPVWALRWYIDRTKSIRTGHEQLFVSTVPPF